MAAVIGNRNISLGVMGGTLITAACYSGGEVFGRSPYDKATTRYLKATYPSYWQAIRDYGFANPQLVPWINEDNDLIVSLVEVGKTRRIRRSGGAYFDSGVNPLVSPRCVADMMKLNTSDTDYWGNNSIGNSTYFTNFGGAGLQYYRYGSTSGANTGTDKPINEVHTWDVGKTVSVDGVLKYTSPNTYAYNASQINILIFRSGRSNNADYLIYRFKIYDGEDLVRNFVPYYHNGVEGMLDLVNLQWYGNANTSGAFTIELTDTPS